MLAGHPDLYSPPELELLSFDRLDDRRDYFNQHNNQFRLEGVIRMLMDLYDCDMEQAKAIMDQHESSGLSTKAFYAKIQSELGQRLLVDKTASYAMDYSTLRRAEVDFENAIYIHLIRHPYGMIKSFEDAKVDQLLFPYAHSFNQRELGELVWTISNQNILQFLQDVPAQRQHCVVFEDLVSQPKEAMDAFCQFMGLEYSPGLLEPTKDAKARMTDPIHPLSRMLGDVKFHTHKHIDSSVAHKWKDSVKEDFLGSPAMDIAAQFGFSSITDATNDEGAEQNLVIKKAPIAQASKLSYAQQRLCFIDEFEEGSPQYNIPMTLRIKGDLNKETLQQSLDIIVDRHEVLRTVIRRDANKQFRQYVQEAASVPIKYIDLNSDKSIDSEKELLNVLQSEVKQTFDLSEDWPLKVCLIELSVDEHALVVLIHHIASDGWSMGIFMQEFVSLYTALSQGSANPLPALPIQYADFGHWQRQQLTGDLFEQQLAYWIKHLAGIPPTHGLPLDKPRPTHQSFQGQRFIQNINPDLYAKLKSLALNKEVSLFMVLQSAFAVLIGRYSGESDVVIGSPIAGRTHQNVEPLIGFFVNMLIHRSNLSENPTYSDLLKTNKQQALDAFECQNIPFDVIVEKLGLERNLSYAPVFQISFNLLNNDGVSSEFSGLKVEHIDFGSTTAKYDLEVSAIESKSELSFSWLFADDLFELETIQRFSESFQILLEHIVAHPETHVAQLNILSREDEDKLDKWNQTHRDYSDTICAHELFELQADKTPDAIAVRFSDQALTYNQLNSRANQVAAFLRDSGVKTDDLVGLYMHRSIEMVIGLLGILKAGGAYLPLEPSFPAKRLSYMAEDSGLELILSASSVNNASALSDQKVILLDDERIGKQLDSYAGDHLEAGTFEKPSPSQLAYAIYTSGSTGEPKGVLVEHGGLVNLLESMQQQYELKADDVYLQKTPFSFDVSVWEFLWPLSIGAQVVVAEPDAHKDPYQLLALINKHQITATHFVPSMLAAMMGTGEFSSCNSLRLVFCGGEALGAQCVNDFHNTHNARLFNRYGPTEATIAATSWESTGSQEQTLIPIGRPFNNVQLYVLDEHLSLLPIGVTGELYIGGVGVARGYLNQDELTAERFISNPLVTEQSDRLYKTGDLVRWLPQGELQYMGRMDEQVKIRGLRVELGEIEFCLNQLEAIRDSAVIVQGEGSDKRLLAFIVAAQDSQKQLHACKEDELKAELHQLLPAYMVPSSFILLDEMPLTNNMKIDRKTLQSHQDIPLEKDDFEPPQTETEKFLASLFSKALNVEKVGRHDDFFNLGGHSLMASQIRQEIMEAFSVDLSLRDMFEATVLSELSAKIEELKEDLIII